MWACCFESPKGFHSAADRELRPRAGKVVILLRMWMSFSHSVAVLHQAVPRVEVNVADSRME